MKSNIVAALELIEKGWNVRTSSPATTITLSQEALSLIKENSKELKGLAYRNMGAARYLLSDYIQSLQDLGTAFNIFTDINNMTEQANCLRNIGNVYHSLKEPETAITKYSEALAICKATSDRKGEAYNLGNIGYVLLKQGNYDSALRHMHQTYQILLDIEDDLGMSDVCTNIAKSLAGKREFIQAREYAEKALIIAKAINHLRGVANGYTALALICKAESDHARAIDYLQQALPVAREMGEQSLVAEILRERYELFEVQQDLQAALKEYKLYSEALLDLERTNNRLQLNVLQAEKQVEKAKQEQQFAENQNRELQRAYEVLDANAKELERLSIVASETGNAIVIADAEGRIEWINDAGWKINGFSPEDFEKLKGKFIWESSTNKNLRSIVQEAILTRKAQSYESTGHSTSEERIVQTTLTPILDEAGRVKKLVFIDADITALKKNELLIQEKNRELERLSLVASHTGNVIIIVAPDGEVEWINDSFTKLNSVTLEELKAQRGRTIFEISNNPAIRDIFRKAEETRASVTYESQMITRHGVKVWEASTLTPIYNDHGELIKFIIIDSDVTERKNNEELIREKNKDITDSIRYAKRIQEAMLPPRELISAIGESSFVFFKPRDIVSGDFYWVNKCSGLTVFAVADCTGHGVPGAFMSLIGVNFLTDIIATQKITSPAAVLTLLDKKIQEALKQRGPRAETQDGMDISLCFFDESSSMIRFAGAHRPLVLIRNNDLIEFKGAKFSVGGSDYGNKEFVDQEVPVFRGDRIYLYSDGITDQMGGPAGKKFKSSRFKELLKEISVTGAEPREAIKTAFTTWKEGYEQIDDVTVMGISF